MMENQTILTDGELVKDIVRFNDTYKAILCDVVLSDKIKEIKGRCKR